MPLQPQLFEVVSCLIVLTAVLGVATWIRRDRRLDKMPGPHGWPLIGIGLGLPPRSILAMHEWALEHGEVFKIRVGWYNWVVLNSPQAVREILDKQVSSFTPVVTLIPLAITCLANISMPRSLYRHLPSNQLLWPTMSSWEECASSLCPMGPNGVPTGAFRIKFFLLL